MMKYLFLATIAALIMSNTHAVDLEQTKATLLSMQTERGQLFQQLQQEQQNARALTSTIAALEQDKEPKTRAFEAAKNAVTRAEQDLVEDNSAIKKAQLDRQLFKQKVAEQDYQKIVNKLADSEAELAGAKAAEQVLYQKLQFLDKDISNQQQQISVILAEQLAAAAAKQQEVATSSVATPVVDEPMATVTTEAPKPFSNYAVIAHPSFTGEPSQTQLKNLFLGKRNSFVTLTSAQAISLPAQDSATAAFNKHVLEMNERKLGAYWSKVIFSGKAERPKELTTTEQIVAYVSQTPNAIAYIPVSSLNSSIKAIYFFN